MYWALVAHEMYFHASAESGELFGIARAQLHNQPDAFVLSTGANAKPFLPLTGLSFASSRPAATVASGLLEAKDSPVKGKNGFAFAPVDKTKASGWLWSWALAIPKSSPDAADAWKYISWATSAQYIKAAGTKTKGGWASIPPGTRLSTYKLPQYQAAAKA